MCRDLQVIENIALNMIMLNARFVEDAHAHLLEQGFKMSLELNNCSSVNGTSLLPAMASLLCDRLRNVAFLIIDTLDKIKKYITDRPDLIKDRNVWIQGMGTQ